MNLVLDASVAGKWLLEESGSDKARAVFEKWNSGHLELIAPALLLAEVASMLWKRAVRGLIPGGKALQLFEGFTKLRLDLVHIEGLAGSALQLSVIYRRPFYDCLYVALALERHCDVLTADERLFRSFSPRLQQVRLLKDWSLDS
ncbi:MAG: type II toxin-antitoxin system VapC family toxin [Terriglobia bacterium]